METEKSLKYEYNLAGGLLLTTTQEDLRRLCEGAKWAGYTHACVLPFRGLMKAGGVENLNQQSLKIIHLEHAWNPTPYDPFPIAILAGLLGYGKRFLGDKTQPPILQDAFFPGQLTCDRLVHALMEALPETKFISHQVNLKNIPPQRLLLEVHDGLGLSAQQILDLSYAQGIGLVFDARHLLSQKKSTSFPGQPAKQLRGEWERQFQALAPQIEVVDINPPQKGDVRDLLAGRGLLIEIASAAKELRQIDFLRVEVPIPVGSQLLLSPKRQAGFAFLKEIGDALKAA